MPGLSYLPEAIPTELGWAHPLTGEQLDTTSGLEDPVAYYKPNSGALSYIDPDGETEFLIFSQKFGTSKVKFAIHSLEPIASVEWDFRDGTEIVGGTSAVHVFGASGTFDVEATINYVDEEKDPDLAEIQVVMVIPAAPVNTVAPTITGSPQVGVETTVANGTWTGTPAPTFTYSWGEVVEGVFTPADITTQAFTPGGGWAGDSLACRVTATNSSGSVTVQTVAKTVAGA